MGHKRIIMLIQYFSPEIISRSCYHHKTHPGKLESAPSAFVGARHPSSLEAEVCSPLEHEVLCGMISASLCCWSNTVKTMCTVKELFWGWGPEKQLKEDSDTVLAFCGVTLRIFAPWEEIRQNVWISKTMRLYQFLSSCNQTETQDEWQPCPLLA